MDSGPIGAVADVCRRIDAVDGRLDGLPMRAGAVEELLAGTGRVVRIIASSIEPPTAKLRA